MYSQITTTAAATTTTFKLPVLVIYEIESGRLRPEKSYMDGQGQ
jgi:hypothetical protein